MAKTADRTWIEKDLKTIANEYEAISEPAAFQVWLICWFHLKGDLSESALEQAYQTSLALQSESGPGDEKLDGFFHDKEDNTLFLYQAVWPESAGKACDAAKAAEVAEALQLLRADSEGTPQASLSPARKEAIEALDDIIASDGRIVLRAVSGGSWSRGAAKRLEKSAPADLSPEIEIFGVKELHKTLEERDEGLEGQKVKFALYGKTTDAQLLHPELPDVEGLGDAAVVLLSGHSVGTIAQKYKGRLFDRNVRYFLGRGQKYNSSMKRTLESNPNEFWYGHNGITILCDGFDLADGKKNGWHAVLENPQIVNGCQTATTLAHCLDDGTPSTKDFAVTARIIEVSGDEEARQNAADDIAYRTNSQTAIRDADLKANDPAQRALQKKLAGYGQSWFYERKRGEWNQLRDAKKGKYKTPKRGDRRIDRDTYQQAWRAFSGKPSSAIVKKNEVWLTQNDELYDEVFADDRRACDAVLAAVSFQWLLQVLQIRQTNDSFAWDLAQKKVARVLRDKYSGDLRTAKSLVAAHTVALLGYVIEEKYGGINKMPEKKAALIIDSLDTQRSARSRFKENRWATPLGDFWQNAMKAWLLYLKEYDKDVTFYQSLKRGSEESFEALKRILDLEVDDLNELIP